MKTLVVLSALASVAFAAPSITDFRNSDVWSETIRRDKKSPHGYFFAESTPVHFADPQIHMNSEIDGPLSSPSARSFGFKKPVFRPTIIKNHHGYHLYRDSEEARAQADPLEDCSKQVKVKLCDAHNKEAKASTKSVKDDSTVKEDNMESRIKLAKEAIEDIQRELKSKEQSPKSAGWKQVESDAEFQQDIEVARKALDHIHRNFGNLESMSLHAEPSHQVHDETVKQNYIQKIGQWKENIESIKRNVDEGRNMEDILQTPDQQPGLNPMATTLFTRNNDKEEAKSPETPAKELTASTEINKDKHIKEDMSIAATTLDSKVQKTEQNHDETEHLKEKSSEFVSIKAAEPHENVDKKTLEPLETKNESVLNKLDSSKMKAADNLEKMKTNDHFQKNTNEEWSHKSNMQFNQPKKSWHEAKFSEHSASTLEKKSDHVEEKILANIETPMKSAEPEKEFKNVHEEQVLSNEKLPNQHSKSADNANVPHMRWAPVNIENMKNKPLPKAAEEFHKDNLKRIHLHTMDHGEAAAAPSNHMDKTHGHASHAHSIKIHEHSMHHPKSADMDEFFQPNLQMNLGDFSGKSVTENMRQWTHKQDSGRAAYGPYGAGGSESYGGGPGAVGVFPNAHVGGCAVPLLLSCSPSVVSGSLAKSGYGHGSSYGPVPAYKAVEENSHNKRDTKKVNEISKEKLTLKTIKSKANTTAKKM